MERWKLANLVHYVGFMAEARPELEPEAASCQRAAFWRVTHDQYRVILPAGGAS